MRATERKTSGYASINVQAAPSTPMDSDDDNANIVKPQASLPAVKLIACITLPPVLILMALILLVPQQGHPQRIHDYNNMPSWKTSLLRNSTNGSCDTPFGTFIGAANNVAAFSNCNSDYTSNESTFVSIVVDNVLMEDIYTGMPWQCVEYARRFWVSTPPYTTFGSVDGACDIWTQLQWGYFIEPSSNGTNSSSSSYVHDTHHGGGGSNRTNSSGSSSSASSDNNHGGSNRTNSSGSSSSASSDNNHGGSNSTNSSGSSSSGSSNYSLLPFYLKKFENNINATLPPRHGDLLIYPRQPNGFPFGHVAVVLSTTWNLTHAEEAATHDDTTTSSNAALKGSGGDIVFRVDIGEQNWDSFPWAHEGRNFSRSLRGTYHYLTKVFSVYDPEGRIAGWVRRPDHPWV